MSRSFFLKLRKLVVYLIKTFGLSQAAWFFWAYIFRMSVIKMRVRSLPLPIWLRPRSTDLWVAYEIFAARELEMPWPLEKVPLTIIDGGANVGFATVALKHRWPDAVILAVEPDSENYSVLMRNIESFQNVVPLQQGIWGSRCSLKVIQRTRRSKCGLQFERVDDNTPGSVASDTVPALIDLLPGKHCDLLKLDIEGAELGVFTMPDLSWIERVSVILIETHGAEARNAVNFAASLFGMKIEQVGEKVMLSRSAR